MRTIFRATDQFMDSVRRDLQRPHRFAHERVGFITVKAAETSDTLLLLAEGYHPVEDDDYIKDNTVGAMMGQEAIRKALNLALLKRVGVFHVHMHFLPGRLWFSGIDLREQLKFVPDFFKVQSKLPHGALVLSPSSAAGRVWLSPTNIVPITEFNAVGTQVRAHYSAKDGSTDFYI